MLPCRLAQARLVQANVPVVDSPAMRGRERKNGELFGWKSRGEDRASVDKIVCDFQ